MEAKPKSAVHRRNVAVGALFFCSGALALVYEVAWHRQFSILLGGAAPAAAAVLAAYFTGLGIGSFAIGRVSPRWGSPLRAYGILEICIGLGAVAVTPLLDSAHSIYPLLAQRFEGRDELFLLVKGVFAFATIAAPTIAMGGTLPILAELIDPWKEHPGRRVGWLYAINTTGAAAGALAFPFLLLPNLGVRATTFLCAGLNLLIGGLCLVLAKKRIATPSAPRPVKREKAMSLPQPLFLAFLSGAGTFALQVLWNRAFAQVHENSIFSFALIVFMFILAIALGATFARLLLSRAINIRAAFSGVWIAGGILTILAPAIFLSLTKNLEYLPMAAWGKLVFLAVLVILLPIALLAAAMPFLFEDAVTGSSHSTGDRTGSILAANIAGSVIGALLAGFVLPGPLGLWNTTLAVALLFVAAGLMVRFRPLSSRLAALSVVAFIAVITGRRDYPRTRLESRAGERLLAISEGAHGVVAVTERGSSRRLKLNNHYVLGGTAAIGDERMQAHIPLVLHRQPRSAAFLGYGTGITAGGAILHPELSATAVELVPKVAALAGEYFGEANLGFATNERTRLVVDDARNFLRISGQNYDVIVGDLVVPWRPGEAGLYTHEHFAQAKRSLDEEGLFSVWIPAFQVTEPEFKIILNTFLAEFARAYVWRGDFSPTDSALALVGFKSAGELNPALVAARLAQLTPDPFNPQLKFPAAFWMHFVGAIEPDDLDPSERRVNSEDLPWLELRALDTPREMFVGRRLQAWESNIGERSRAPLSQKLSVEANAGWQAGALMREFTLLLREGRRGEASRIQSQIRQLLGTAAAESIFGPAQ